MVISLTKVDYWEDEGQIKYQYKQLILNHHHIISAYDYIDNDPFMKEIGIQTVIICKDYNQYLVTESIAEIWNAEYR